jgi:molybdopterin biosynthesis enzyme MoaB
VLLVFFAFSPVVFAQVSQSFGFTGKITESDGSELPDGVYDLGFYLYDAPSGGVPLWGEELSAASSFAALLSNGVAGVNTVTYDYASDSEENTLRVGQYLSSNDTGEAVLIFDFDTALNTITVVGGNVWADATAVSNRPFIEGGVIDISLGAVSPLSGVDFNQQLYLEVVFNGEIMRPRKMIDSVLQAFNADTLDGFHASDFANLSGDSTVSGQWTFNNLVSIATSSDLTALTVTQSGAGSLVDFKLGSSTAFAVLNDGRVQFGNYYFPANNGLPGYVLKASLDGNMYWDVDYSGSTNGYGVFATTSDNLLIRQTDVAQKIVFGNIATTAPIDIQFEVQGTSWFDTLAVSNQQALRFYDSDSSNYIGFRATSSLAADTVLTLPGGYGVIGQTLLTDGSGNLSWGMPAGNGIVNAASMAGQIPFYASAENILTATSAIFIDQISGYIGIGTTAPNKMFSVNGGGEFAELCVGGACISDWSGANSIDGSGNGGYIALWVDSNTLGSEQYLSSARGGLGQSFSGATGFVYFDGGSASASSTIAISLTDLSAGTGLAFSGSTLTIDAGGNWTGTFDGQEGAYYLNAVNLNNFIIPFSSALAGTTTDALAEGTRNLYWTDNRFDTRLSATSSLPNITSLNGLETIGTITSGTWNATTLGVDYGGTGADSSGWTGIAFVNSGVWGASSTLSTAFGGTGFSSYTPGDILYANSSGNLTRLAVGGESDILVISPSGLPSWVSTSSIGLDIQNMTGILGVASGGTGQNFSGATGFMYFDGGVANASNTISIAYTDLMATGLLSLNNNILELDITGNWTGTFDNLEGADIFTLADWFATTSAPQLTALVNLTSVGNITSGAWQAGVIDVQYGGLGTTTFETNSLLYASAANTIGEVLSTVPGRILQLSSSGVPTWVATSTLGIDFSSVAGTLTTDQGGTGQDSSAWTGFAYVSGGVWSASGTIAASGLDSLVMLQGENISLLNNDANYITITEALAGLSANLPLTYNNTSGEFSINMASSTASGYLSSADWTTFNSKQSALILGNLTESNSTLLTITGGTGATIGNVTIEVDSDLGNYDNTNTNFITLGNFSAVSPVDYNSGTGVISLNVVPVSYGGLGTTTFEANSLLYASAANTIGEVLSTVPGRILQLNPSGVPTWVATNTLGIDLSSVGGILEADQGGTGEDTSTWTGFAYINAGAWSASSTIAASRLDSLVMLQGENISLLNNDANYITLSQARLGLNASLPLTYNNTSGVFSINMASSTANGYLSAADWTTFNNKQNVLTLGNLTESNSALLTITGGTGATIGNVTIEVDNDLSNYDNTVSAFITLSGISATGPVSYDDATGIISLNVVPVSYGGLGTTTFEANSLLYASAANTIGEVLSTVPGRILQLNASGVPTWVGTTSLGIDFSSVGGILTTDQGGTGQDSSGWTGFAYVNGGVWSASNTIAATRLDSVVMLQGENISLLNNDANYITLSEARQGLSADLPLTYNNTSGTFAINQASSTANGYLSSADWTTFNNKQSALTLGNLTESNSTLLTITGGTGATIGNVTIEVNRNLSNYDNTTTAFISRTGISATSPINYDNGTGVISLNVVPVSYGGLGTTTFAANSLLYASAANTIGEVLSTVPGRILQLNSSGVPTWVATNSLGIDFSSVGGTLTAAQGGTGQDSSGWTGFAYVNGGVWSASNTIAATRLDSVVMLQGENISLLNNDANYITLSEARQGLSADLPLTYNNTSGTFAINQASSTANGYLSSVDWTTFNSKQSALTLGNLTESNSTLLTITGGTGATIGNVTIEVNRNLSNYDNTTTAFISRTGISATSPINYDNGTGVISLNVVPVSYGGLGTTTFAANSLLYASAANTIGEVLSTVPGRILQLNSSGVPTWVATNSLGIDFSSVGGTLTAAQGGTGQDSSGWTGFAYVNGGVWSASNTIAATRLDSVVMLQGENISLLNNDANYITLSEARQGLSADLPLTYNNTSGTFAINQASSTANGYLSSVDWTTFNAKQDVVALPAGHIYMGSAGGLPVATSALYIMPNGNIGIGTTSAVQKLSIDGNILINGSLMPINNSNTYVGTLANRFFRGYFENLDVTNMTIGSTSISGSASNIFTINSNNMTADTEDGMLAFERGTIEPNAIITWDSSFDIFSFNFPIGIEDNGELRLYEDVDNGYNYAGFRASSTLGSDLIWVLPTNQGLSGEALMLDTAGNMVWGTPTGAGTINSGNTGQIPYYAGPGNILSATSSIFINNSNSYIGIGTTTPNKLLSVAGSGEFGSLCLGGICLSDWSSAGNFDGIGADGQIVYWVDGNTLGATSSVAVSLGGTGRSSWSQYSIPYLTSNNNFGEITIGTSTYLLAVNSSGNGYTWISASSTGIDTVRSDEEIRAVVGGMVSLNTETLITVTYEAGDGTLDFIVNSDLSQFNNSISQFFSTTTDILAPNFGGTGQDSSGWTGFAYVNGGVWSASNTIAATRLDSVVMLQGENISLLNNDANYITLSEARQGLSADLPLTYNNTSGTFAINQASSTANGYLSSADWTTFNNKQSALTLGNLTESNSTLLTITGGTGATIGNVTIEVNRNLSNYDNTTTAFISRTGISATSPINYDNGTGVISLNVVPVSYGGLGTTTFAANSLLYASAANTIGEVLSTVPGRILQLNSSGVPTWVATNSLGIDFSSVGGTLTAAQGGTGQDSSGWTGFAYVNGGVWSASNTIAATRLDSVVMLQGENISLLNNDANYITLSEARQGLSADLPLTYNNTSGTFAINQASSTANGYLSSVDWTTFNNKQSALTLGNLTESNSTLLTITGGTGATIGNVTIEVNRNLSNYDNTTTAFISRTGISATSPINYDNGTGVISLNVVPVSYGGLGTTTFAANSLLYASAANTIGEVLSTVPGRILQLNSSGVPTWVATNSLGIDFSSVGGTLTAAQGGTGQDSSGWTGFAYVNGGVWSASNTIAATRLDSVVMLQGENISLLNNDANYITLSEARQGLSADLPLTYNNTSGTFAINQASSTANGYLSSVDWTTFNNKQSALTLGNLTESNSTLLTITGGTGATIGNVTIEVNRNLSNYDNTTTAFISRTGISATSPINYDNGTGVISLNVVPVSYGGLGTTTFEANSLLYASAANTIGEVLSTVPGRILQLNSSGVPTWVATNSLNIALADTTGILSAARGGTNWNSSAITGIPLINNGVWGSSTTLPTYRGGTNWDSSAATGFTYVSGGVWSASNTIAATRLDSVVMLQGENISS